MRIDLTNLAPEPPEQGKPGRAGQPDNTSTAAGNNSTLDKTSFSFDQARVDTLANQVLAQPDVRAAKVQSLQQAISNGEYSVLPGQIADALAAEFGGAQG